MTVVTTQFEIRGSKADCGEYREAAGAIEQGLTEFALTQLMTEPRRWRQRYFLRRCRHSASSQPVMADAAACPRLSRIRADQSLQPNS